MAAVAISTGGYAHHDKGVEVHYSVVTEHKGDSHGHGHGGHGHDGHGHAEVQAWGHDSGHDGDDGHDDHDGDHYDGHYGGHDQDHDGPAKYEFSYGVKDTKTGDIKNQEEARDGDKVKGSYTWLS